MQLSIADYTDTIQIIRQVHDLWSAGLSKEHYRQLFWSTHYQTWSKNNIYRMVHKIKNEVVASCKITHLPLIQKTVLIKY